MGPLIFLARFGGYSKTIRPSAYTQRAPQLIQHCPQAAGNKNKLINAHFIL